MNADGTLARDLQVPLELTTYAYDGHGARTEEVYIIGPGLDGLWCTDDDVVGDRTTYLTDR